MASSDGFDYFYGTESEQYSFYRIPRLLVTGERFKDLSIDAKLLYGLLLDRMAMSAKNGWYDDDGRVYIYYTLSEIMEALNCGHDRALRMLAELDQVKGIGLIERRKQGQGRPTIIYVKRFAVSNPPSPSDNSRLREQVEYSALAELYQGAELDEILALIVEVLCSTNATIRVNGSQIPIRFVQERFHSLDRFHIQYVIECFRENTTNVRNIRAYLLTTLYNAPTTIEHYYKAKVQHDLYGQ